MSTHRCVWCRTTYPRAAAVSIILHACRKPLVFCCEQHAISWLSARVYDKLEAAGLIKESKHEITRP
jgi:hypothetical protein